MTHPTKLTLRLDSGLIESAEAFAADHQRSMSQLAADYFARLADQPALDASPKAATSRRANALVRKGSARQQRAELSPLTINLRGVLKVKSTPKSIALQSIGADPDKAAYRRHLEDKHRRGSCSTPTC